MDGASENWQAISDRQRAAQSSNASSFFITIPLSYYIYYIEAPTEKQ